jgi:Tfp pilus assembly protein PilN
MNIETTTLAQEIKESQLMEEKHLVVKELMNYIHHAQFDRTTLTSEMLKELRGKIDEMLLSDF